MTLREKHLPAHLAHRDMVGFTIFSCLSLQLSPKPGRVGRGDDLHFQDHNDLCASGLVLVLAFGGSS